jgi:hypothetical protein
MSAEPWSFTEEEAHLDRVCANCGNHYTIEQAPKHYLGGSYGYWKGCVTNCLTCWLDCGPSNADLEGNLLREIGAALAPETHLVVMPLSRIMLSTPVAFQSRAIIYPRGVARLGDLDLVLPKEISESLQVYQSSAAFVDKESFARSETIAFPCTFEWDAFWRTSHKNHMELIRFFSQVADLKCLNLIRYRLCSIEVPDALPGRAGQIAKDNMMAGALLYNAFRREGGIVAGDAFNSVLTKGLGLPIDDEDLNYNDYPQDGEVGHIAQHGLDLYSTMLQADNPTAKFTQAMGLLEFLAEPTDFIQFKEVAKIVSRYVAKDTAEYERLRERFFELTGKRDPLTKAFTGFRTRIIHMGDRLERIVPELEKRTALLKVLDGYIRAVLDHMIEHSTWGFEEYKDLRAQMRPFDSN